MSFDESLKRSVYARVKKAAERGNGVRLSYLECQELYLCDEAFKARADLDSEGAMDPDDLEEAEEVVP
jgi:hypothetical protein